MTRSRLGGVCLLAVCVLLAACSGGTDAGAQHRAGVRRVAVTGPVALSGAELRYGAGARDTGAFTYQPDVVFLGGGASSIKAATADGLVWTIDGHAAHADEVVPGKVLLATSFAAGRVLAVEEVGDDKRVALGPVALTDVIRDGSFGTDDPIPLEGFQVYSTPDQPGLVTDTGVADGPGADAGATAPGGGATSSTAANSRRSAPARAAAPAAPAPAPAPAAGARPAPVSIAAFAARPSAVRSALLPGLSPFPPPADAVPPSQVGDWHVQSSCCTAAQVHVSYDKGGARVQGTATLGFEKPGVSFGIVIAGGRLVDASVSLHGAAELGFGIAAAVESSGADFHGGRIQLPVDIDIPVPVAGLPLTVGIHQVFSVSLGLSGKATLSTTGEYALGGSLGFALRDGRVQVLTPTLRTTRSALDNVQSLAVAPQGLTFAYAVRLSIGIGPPGLNAGLWYQVAAALGLATSGGRLDPFQGTSLVTCKTVSLSLQGRYGVGYTIPKLVAAAVNFFLRTFFPRARPLQPSGGPSWGPSILFNQSTPPCSK